MPSRPCQRRGSKPTATGPCWPNRAEEPATGSPEGGAGGCRQTFTDIERFDGTCHKAAGWQPCGITKGFTRMHRAFLRELRASAFRFIPFLTLSKLIAAAERGEEVIIARRDKTVVQLHPVRESRRTCRIGGLKGKHLRMGANCDSPILNDEIAKAFNGP